MFGKLLAGAGAIAFALALAWMHGNARYAEGHADQRADVATVAADQASAQLATYAKGVAEGQEGARRFMGWANDIFEPATKEILRETIRYEQSPSGALVCFDADGVSGANKDIDTAAATFTAPPGGSDAEMSAAGAYRNTGKRIGDAGASPPLDFLGSLVGFDVRTETRAPH